MLTSPTILLQTEAALQEAAERALAAKPTMTRELKPDGSIVTSVDKMLEEFLRGRLLAITPGAAYWGEEFGFEEAGGKGLWVVDPVDGTSNFAFGGSTWGISAAYLQGGAIQLGVIAMPELGLFLSSARGQGATLNGKPLPPIPPGAIRPEELMSCGSLEMLLADGAWLPGNARHIGSFVVEAAYVATQRFRAMVSCRVKLYDCAAGVLACRELGAEVRMFDGSPWNEADWTSGKPLAPFAIVPKDSGFPFGEHA